MIPEPSKDFYGKFIKIEQGQKVHKGDIIAYMYTPPGVEGHIHFHIQRSNQNGLMAPAIFTQEIVDQFQSRWKEFGIDNGTAMPSCMGYMLGANENPFGTGAADQAFFVFHQHFIAGNTWYLYFFNSNIPFSL